MGLHKDGHGHKIIQETRLYDESKLETFSMRSKEGEELLFHMGNDSHNNPLVPPMRAGLISNYNCLCAGLADYRYFPEPDLPPVQVSEEFIEEVQVHSSFHNVKVNYYGQTVVPPGWVDYDEPLYALDVQVYLQHRPSRLVVL